MNRWARPQPPRAPSYLRSRVPPLVGASRVEPKAAACVTLRVHGAAARRHNFARRQRALPGKLRASDRNTPPHIVGVRTYIIQNEPKFPSSRGNQSGHMQTQGKKGFVSTSQISQTRLEGSRTPQPLGPGALSRSRNFGGALEAQMQSRQPRRTVPSSA